MVDSPRCACAHRPGSRAVHPSFRPAASRSRSISSLPVTWLFSCPIFSRLRRFSKVMLITYQKKFRFTHDTGCKLFAYSQLGSELVIRHNYRIDFPAKFLAHIRQSHYNVGEGCRPDDTDINITCRLLFSFPIKCLNIPHIFVLKLPPPLP